VSDYAAKRARLENAWQDDGSPLRLQKKTISNLFRYQGKSAPARRLSLADFDQVIALDPGSDDRPATIEVEGLATFETIVRHALAHGFLPLVAPELRHITIGGATVGIGIESTCFRYGFVHDSVIEADVLLPSGHIVTARADNEHAELFHALPNSYGTLGYILRAVVRLHRAQPFVRLGITLFDDAGSYLEAMQLATESDADFVEGLFFEDRRFYLMTGRFAASVPERDDIVRRNIFYQLVGRRDEINLTAEDYIFRYDPEWFWNIPDTWFYRLFRRYAPLRFRNSGFYTRYAAAKNRLLAKLPGGDRSGLEPLIQDWEVPWARGEELIEYALREVRLDGRPWAAVPIRTPRQPTIYPIAPGELYFNLGCYCQVRRPEGREPYHYTRIMDAKCFELGGIKMLYSSTFLDKGEFDARFNGPAYAALKKRYDPDGRTPTLFEKVSMPG
jgi:FAD/FMN-containing dehydrogenase